MALNLPPHKAVMIVYGSDATGDQAEAASRVRATVSPNTRDVKRVFDPATLTADEKARYYTPFPGKRSVAAAGGAGWDSLDDDDSTDDFEIEKAFVKAEAHIS